MKKITSLIILIILCLTVITGCGSDDSNPTNDKNAEGNVGDTTLHDTDINVNMDDDIIEIKEKMFVAQTNDVYINAKDYLGKTFKYEGLVKTFSVEGADDVHCVIRYGPGCCGNDGDCGFEIVWDEEFPADNEWVEVVGVLEAFEFNGVEYIRIKADTVTVLEERGAETVTQ